MLRKSSSFSETENRPSETPGERGNRNRSFEIHRQQSNLSIITERTERSTAPLTGERDREQNHTTNFLESMSQKIPDFFKKFPELLNKVNCYGKDGRSASPEDLGEVSNYQEQQERQERLQNGNRAISEAHTIYTQGVMLGRDPVTRSAYRLQNPIDAFHENQTVLYRSYLMDTALSIGEWTRKYEQAQKKEDKDLFKKTLDGYKRFFQERMLSEFHRITGGKHPMEDTLTQSNIQSNIDIESIRPVDIQSS